MRSIATACLLLFFAPLLLAQEATSSAWRGPQIITSAQGESRITPDRATISIGVETRATTAAQASADNAKRQRAVLDTIRALGVPAELISTSGYGVRPEIVYPQTGGGTPHVTGYVVSNTVRVELRRIELTGSVIDAAITKGANTINSLEYFASNADSARHLAMASAVIRARADAEAIARAAGGRIGGLLEISIGGGFSPQVQATAMQMRGSAQVPTPIAVGEQTVTVFIVSRWLFESMTPH
ncbi:MAG: SIMPL domain-containing protein [Gemmatimonadota bacterium]|nr:SIMPL domain-containing protein [Gemmatimonadota bacterium]